jgi:hypothetical protein
MNTAISCVQCLTLLKTAAALMFSLIGPPLSKFNAENYVTESVKKGHCHATTLLAQLLQKGHTKYPAMKIPGKFFKGV